MAKIHNPHDENDIKLVNQTVLDGEISTLENAISTETSRAEGVESTLEAAINQEVEDRKTELMLTRQQIRNKPWEIRTVA